MGEQDRDAAALEALRWLIEAGADEAVAEAAVDRYAVAAAPPSVAKTPASPPRIATSELSPRPPDPSPPVWAPVAAPPAPPQELLEDARRLAAAAADLNALHDSIRAFDGCSLKQSATNTVIYRGNPESKIMLIGEAPGREEDLQGRPFVGAAGQLLDRLLTWAGFDPEDVFITNLLFWRPPGNRTPETREIALCLPFIERHIVLMQPEYLLLIGNVSTQALLGQKGGITRLRGRWFPYSQEGLGAPVPAMAMLHPAFLLRQPAQKRLAWRDILAFREAVTGGIKAI
ncbi:MAG TPA: uracil-DNA glycosylase [Kiloniellales bacterium]|jgi:uracil-DNA glycosylase family 4|nr:uracil-DNA glycosylase [Kiloniellales bacterium]